MKDNFKIQFSADAEMKNIDYCEAFGNLARLVTGAIATNSPAERSKYLEKCQDLIEMVYTPVLFIEKKEANCDESKSRP
ncbi:MAG: hypothetical protein AAF609_14970 [Cyanobacteria bacterium P01_C01_bin.120]